jgi:hypothetical protein
MAIHYKAVTKKESEIKMSNSQRLPATGSIINVDEPKPISQDGGAKEKAFMTLFLLLSMVVMYYSMHPSRKV